MVENLADDAGIFNAGDDLDGAAAGLSGLDVDVQYALQALRPGHCCSAFGGRCVFRPVRRAGLVTLAPLGRRHPRTMRAVRGENPVKSSQVDSGLRYQGDKPDDEVQRLENDVRGAIAVRCLELVTHVAIGSQRQAFF